MRQFGGRAAEGVIVVSTTGMVGAVMITKDIQNPVSFATESLGSIRQRIMAVDICYGKSKLRNNKFNRFWLQKLKYFYFLNSHDPQIYSTLWKNVYCNKY